MSFFDRVISGLRDILLLQYKVEQLTKTVETLNARQGSLTERLIRLEVIIGEAQRGRTARRPMLPRE